MPQIIPLLPKDQWKPIANIRTVMFFLVRDVLDGELMRDSLDKLIREHASILGARLKNRAKDGALEYHFPSEGGTFPKGYELFWWSTKEVDSRIEETGLVHEDGDEAETKQRKDRVLFSPNMNALEATWAPPDWPVERKYEKTRHAYAAPPPNILPQRLHPQHVPPPPLPLRPTRLCHAPQILDPGHERGTTSSLPGSVP